MRLLTQNNAKVQRGSGGRGYHVAVLHLAPADAAGRGTVCPWSTDACRAGCLNRAGRGGIVRKGEMSNAIQRARIRRTLAFQDHRSRFIDDLRADLTSMVRGALRRGLRPAVRLNGTSDLAWESIAPDLFLDFPGVIFYDYTKSAARVRRMLEARDWSASVDSPATVIGRRVPAWWPRNYDLTFSWSGTNGADAVALLRSGARVAVPFHGRPPVGARVAWTGGPVWRASADLPTWDVIDGDSTDLRFLDPGACIVGLKAKGPAKRDRSGWVVDLDEGRHGARPAAP